MSRAPVTCWMGRCCGPPCRIVAGPQSTSEVRQIRRRGGVSQNGVLARVLTRQHVRAVYQPIRDLRDGVIAGYEALARPADVADDGSVVDFFRAARQEGQIRDLEWLCRRAALDGAKGVDGAFLSLNLDPDIFESAASDADALGQLLSGAGRTPATLVVEATCPESLEVERLLTMLLPYRNLGVRVALAGVDIDEQRQLETS